MIHITHKLSLYCANINSGGRSTPGEKQKNDIKVEIVRDYYTPFDDPEDLA